MLARREKELYYNYDEKFHPDHKCKAFFFLLVAKEPEDDNNTPLDSLADPKPLLVNNEYNELS